MEMDGVAPDSTAPTLPEQKVSPQMAALIAALQRERDRQGLSDAAFARGMDVSPQNWCRLQGGKVREPKQKFWGAVATRYPQLSAVREAAVRSFYGEAPPSTPSRARRAKQQS